MIGYIVIKESCLSDTFMHFFYNATMEAKKLYPLKEICLVFDNVRAHHEKSFQNHFLHYQNHTFTPPFLPIVQPCEMLYDVFKNNLKRKNLIISKI